MKLPESMSALGLLQVSSNLAQDYKQFGSKCFFGSTAMAGQCLWLSGPTVQLVRAAARLSAEGAALPTCSHSQHGTICSAVCSPLLMHQPNECLQSCVFCAVISALLQDFTVDVTTSTSLKFEGWGGEKVVEEPKPADSAVLLPSSIFADLTALTALKANIANQTLPEVVGSQLTRLQQLQLTCCNLISLPGSICRLSQLRVLLLRGAQQLRHLPEALGGLPALQELQLSGLGQPTQLPASFTALTALTALHISGCVAHIDDDDKDEDEFYTRVEGLCAAAMSSLQLLLIERCQFSSLVELGGASLQELRMQHCEVESNDVSGASSLQKLKLGGMSCLRYVYVADDLACLSVLDVKWVRARACTSAAAVAGFESQRQKQQV
jgi:hypothetical protein